MGLSPTNTILSEEELSEQNVSMSLYENVPAAVLLPAWAGSTGEEAFKLNQNDNPAIR